MPAGKGGSSLQIPTTATKSGRGGRGAASAAPAAARPLVLQSEAKATRKFEAADVVDLGFTSYASEHPQEGWDVEDWDEEGWNEMEEVWDDDDEAQWGPGGGDSTGMPGVRSSEAGLASKVRAASPQ